MQQKIREKKTVMLETFSKLIHKEDVTREELINKVLGQLDEKEYNYDKMITTHTKGFTAISLNNDKNEERFNTVTTAQEPVKEEKAKENSLNEEEYNEEFEEVEREQEMDHKEESQPFQMQRVEIEKKDEMTDFDELTKTELALKEKLTSLEQAKDGAAKDKLKLDVEALRTKQQSIEDRLIEAQE